MCAWYSYKDYYFICFFVPDLLEKIPSSREIKFLKEILKKLKSKGRFSDMEGYILDYSELKQANKYV